MRFDLRLYQSPTPTSLLCWDCRQVFLDGAFPVNTQMPFRRYRDTTCTSCNRTKENPHAKADGDPGR